jgi:allantoate deiminase
MCRCFARRGRIRRIAEVNEGPNSRLQASGKFQTPSPKSSRALVQSLELGAWNLELMKATEPLMRRIEALACVTDVPGNLTRTFASPAMRRANDLVASWMRKAGMNTRVDAIGNLIGHYDGAKPDAKILLLGSHLDTVPDAGKFDGPLGVILAIAGVEALHHQKIRLPFAIDVLGLADEEGVRYQTAYLGSKVLAGAFEKKDLNRQDADGISMRDAIRNFGGNPARLGQARLNPRNLLGYLEAHIEQGPVLEENNLAVGVVTAIAGQSRYKLAFTGSAGHAGTTPMKRRRDALCAASECVLAVESHARKTPGLLATIGQLRVEPGASNVIPGATALTLDVRHERDSVRIGSSAMLQKVARKIASVRRVKVSWQLVQQTDSVPCPVGFSTLLKQAVKKHQHKVVSLPSGAGHDAGVIGKITPAAMLFIRCKGGLSHHPEESVRPGDVAVALDVLSEFIRLLAAMIQ